VRVAVISDLIRPNGAGVMALLGAQVLADAGHEVKVLGGAMSAELERQLSDRHGGAASFTNDERALDGSVTASDHIALRRAVQRWLDAQLQEWAPAALYVHNCGRILGQLDLADLSRRYPVIHTMHDEWFISDAHYTFRSPHDGSTVRTFEPGRSENVLEHRYDHLFDVPGRLGSFVAIAPSAWLADRARRVFPTVNVQHVENAVDSEFFRLQERHQARDQLGLPHDRAIVLFVGSPTQERKGFALFEPAMRVISRDGVAPVRLIAGGSASAVTEGFADSIRPGPIADNLAVPASSPLGAIGVEGDALVIAGLDRTLIPALYGAADVLVHPSVIDNLPTVPIEAALCGTRCLASDVGGTRETIADTSDLFPIDATRDMIGKRIADALRDAEQETIDDRQSRRNVQLERFGIDRHRDRMISILGDVVARAES
jgi:glycosyltransferase involved in cell wall biosynthesis